MRITQEQRKENIQSVFRATIDLSKDKPFDDLTMKAIAKAAGIGEATIYNYFPKKELILTGYFEWSLNEALEQTRTDLVEEMSFTEKIQALLENHLRILQPGKTFFADSVQSLFINPISLSQSTLRSAKSQVIAFLAKELEQAIELQQLPEPPFQNFLLELIWDYHLGVLYYWIKDPHPDSNRTTEFIDLSLKILEELLKSDLINKIYSVAHFLFREHLLSKLLSPPGRGH